MNKVLLKPVVLIILDGWGISSVNYFNPIKDANPERFYYYWNNYPKTALKTYPSSFNSSKYTMPSLACGYFENNINNLNVLTNVISDKESFYKTISSHNLRQLVISDKLVSKELPMYLNSFDSDDISNCDYKYVNVKLDKKPSPEENEFKQYIDVIESEKTGAYDFITFYFPYLELIQNNKQINTIIRNMDYVVGEIIERYLLQNANIFVTSSYSSFDKMSKRFSLIGDFNYVPFININNHNKRANFLSIKDFLPTIIMSKYNIGSIAPTIINSFGIPSKFDFEKLNNIL